MKYQRDSFISEIHSAAKLDPEILFLSADFGAPALDAFRSELPKQFIHCGISEQNMIDLATGFALDGRKVYCYAMAPFVSLRCLEQHKCGAGIMKLPICTIVAGIGLGYADAGPTHYATEDLACLKSIVGSTVYTCSDAYTAAMLAQYTIKNPEFSFIRLDRNPVADLTEDHDSNVIAKGYREVLKGNSRTAVISHGYILHRVLSSINKFQLDVTAYDLIRCKPLPPQFVDELKSYDSIVVIDEQTPHGSLPSVIMEAFSDISHRSTIRRLTLPERYFFENGGREHLLNLAGLGEEKIAETIRVSL